METLNNAAISVNQRRSGAITLAAVLYGWFGFAFIVSSVLIGVYALQNGRLPVLFGIDMLAGPISHRYGVNATIATTIPWGIVNVLEMLVGRWLWQSRKRGGKLALVLLPLGAIFWIGYALPIMALIGPLRVLLIAKVWRVLR
jgi:hypothetical protein